MDTALISCALAAAQLNIAMVIANVFFICDYSVNLLIADLYGAWQTPDEGFMDQCVFIGDWLVGHPMRMEQQRALGAENPYRALFENDDTYYITKKNFSTDILKYLQENYDDRITVSYVKNKGDLKIYKYSLGE